MGWMVYPEEQETLLLELSAFTYGVFIWYWCLFRVVLIYALRRKYFLIQEKPLKNEKISGIGRNGRCSHH